MFTWYDGESGGYNITLSWDTVLSCSHQGQCGDDVAAELTDATIRRQLEQYNVDDLREIVRGYGIDPEKLEETKDVYRYLLWIACGDIKENPATYCNSLPESVTAVWDDVVHQYYVKCVGEDFTIAWRGDVHGWESMDECTDMVNDDSDYFETTAIHCVGGPLDGETVE